MRQQKTSRSDQFRKLGKTEMRLITDSAIGYVAVWTEAEGEPFEGKLAVAEVMQRRAKCKYMSDGTIAGTLALRYQFSALNDDRINNQRLIAALKIDSADPNVMDCIRAWNAVSLPGYVEIVPSAVLYCNLQICHPAWATGNNFIKTIGNHSFYKAN